MLLNFQYFTYILSVVAGRCVANAQWKGCIAVDVKLDVLSGHTDTGIFFNNESWSAVHA